MVQRLGEGRTLSINTVLPSPDGESGRHGPVSPAGDQPAHVERPAEVPQRARAQVLYRSSRGHAACATSALPDPGVYGLPNLRSPCPSRRIGRTRRRSSLAHYVEKAPQGHLSRCAGAGVFVGRDRRFECGPGIGRAHLVLVARAGLVPGQGCDAQGWHRGRTSRYAEGLAACVRPSRRAFQCAAAADQALAWACQHRDDRNLSSSGGYRRAGDRGPDVGIGRHRIIMDG